jgi:hypothetical protein
MSDSRLGCNGTGSSVMHATDGMSERKEAPEYTSLDATIITTETKVEIRLHHKSDAV